MFKPYKKTIMKKSNLKLMLVMFSVVCLLSFKSDHKDGVQFIQGYNEAVKISKALDKPIFVFVHTKSCTVSKRMDAQIFTKTELGEYLNDNFICLSMDPDNVFENFRVSNWGATGVPSYVFLDMKRKMVSISSGYKDEKTMKRIAQDALEKIQGETSADKGK